LAGRLQGLILAVLAAAGVCAAGDKRPFSHRLHLKLKPDCVQCHVSAASSTHLEDNNLPPNAVCLPCHKDVSVKEPRRTLLSRFNHQKHVKLGDIGKVIAAAIDNGAYLSASGDMRRRLNDAGACRACHRGLEESGAVSRAAFPEMADCLVCHPKIQPPFSCEFCHRPEEHLKPASHTPDFLDSHTSGAVKLDKSSCAVCHGRKFRCLGCH
jgi:hypothetical protein